MRVRLTACLLALCACAVETLPTVSPGSGVACDGPIELPVLEGTTPTCPSPGHAVYTDPQGRARATVHVVGRDKSEASAVAGFVTRRGQGEVLVALEVERVESHAFAFARMSRPGTDDHWVTRVIVYEDETGYRVVHGAWLEAPPPGTWDPIRTYTFELTADARERLAALTLGVAQQSVRLAGGRFGRSDVSEQLPASAIGQATFLAGVLELRRVGETPATLRVDVSAPDGVTQVMTTPLPAGATHSLSVPPAIQLELTLDTAGRQDRVVIGRRPAYFGPPVAGDPVDVADCTPPAPDVAARGVPLYTCGTVTPGVTGEFGVVAPLGSRGEPLDLNALGVRALGLTLQADAEIAVSVRIEDSAVTDFAWPHVSVIASDTPARYEVPRSVLAGPPLSGLAPVISLLVSGSPTRTLTVSDLVLVTADTPPPAGVRVGGTTNTIEDGLLIDDFEDDFLSLSSLGLAVSAGVTYPDDWTEPRDSSARLWLTTHDGGRAGEYAVDVTPDAWSTLRYELPGLDATQFEHLELSADRADFHVYLQDASGTRVRRTASGFGSSRSGGWQRFSWPLEDWTDPNTGATVDLSALIGLELVYEWSPFQVAVAIDDIVMR